MILIALVIGLAGGLGAVFFRWLIGFLQGVVWGAGGTPLEKVLRAPWYWRLGAPAAGGLLVGLIVRFMAPEAKGHGVPEVMYATARGAGVIRPVVAVAKSLASAVCIATGGSVGREGPIVQIASAMASAIGQLMRIPVDRMRICVGCGAAAGIAATFNAPIAGAFFAAEVILGGFSTASFAPVVISSVAATVLSHSMLGDVPAFEIPPYSLVNPAEMLTYAVLGLLAGLSAVVFIRALSWTEDFFDNLTVLPDYLQPVLGGFGVGALALVVPDVMGVGYDTITGALRAELVLGVLVAVFGAKLLATTLTLGSGGSGGVFAPSLLMGAALGGSVGLAAQSVLPFPMASAGAYAVVGMGAMVAATTHAPITAIVIIFELTGDYRVILALMLSCILSTVLAQRISRASIYTIKLLRRGIDLEAGREINVLRSLHVRDVVRSEIDTVPRTLPLHKLQQRIVESPHYEFFTVDGDGNLVGVISVDDLRRCLPYLDELGTFAIAEDIAHSQPLFVREDDTLDFVMRQFEKRVHEQLPVLPSGDSMRPLGTVRRHDLITTYNREMLKADLGAAFSDRIDSAVRLRSWETVGGYVLALVEAPSHLSGQTLSSLNLPQRMGIQLILIDRGEKYGEDRFVLPTRDAVLITGQQIVVFGQRTSVDALLSE